MTGRWENTKTQDCLNFNNLEQPSPTPFGAQQKTNNVVLVSKLQIGTALTDIYITFRQFGEIEYFKYFEAQREAVVQFSDPASAAAALQEEAVQCGGKTVFVHPYDCNKEPTSSDTSYKNPLEQNPIHSATTVRGTCSSSEDEQHEHHIASNHKPHHSPMDNRRQYPSGNVSYGQPQQRQPRQEGYYSSEAFRPYTPPYFYGTSGVNRNAQKMDISRSEKHRFIDLCFMIDGTGGMVPYLDLTVKSIKDIISKLQQQRLPTKIIRLAYVVYRDYPQTTTAPVVEHLNFIQDANLFMNSLSKVQAVEGGDECEDVVSGLVKVQELEWNSNTRILVWIADAPCHGERFHDGRDDTYSKAPPKERLSYSEKELLEGLRLLSIRNFFFLKINNTTDKMVNLFKDMFDGQGFELKQEAISKENFVNQIIGHVMYSVDFHQKHTKNVVVVERQQGSLLELTTIIQDLGYCCLTTTDTLKLPEQHRFGNGKPVDYIFMEFNRDLFGGQSDATMIKSHVRQTVATHSVTIIGVGQLSNKLGVDRFISQSLDKREISVLLQ